MQARSALLFALIAASVIGTAVWAAPNKQACDALQASFACTAQVLDVQSQFGGEDPSLQGDRPDERILQISFPSDSGDGLCLLDYYLRAIFRLNDVTKQPLVFDTLAISYEPSEPEDCTYAHYTSRLLSRGGQDQPVFRDTVPGVVSLCNGKANGSLPVNASHTGRIESLKAASPVALNSSDGWPHRLNVYPTRSRMESWRLPDGLTWSDGRQGTGSFGTELRPTEGPHRRVRRNCRQSSGCMEYMAKKHPDGKNRFKYLPVNVTFNLQPKFLAKNGPYIIKIHVFLDSHFTGRLGRDVKEMLRASKEVVNYANHLLRPFNAYLMVTSFDHPVPRDGQTGRYESRNGDILESVFEYVINSHRAIYDEVNDCTVLLLGRSRNNYTLSGAHETMSGGKATMCKRWSRKFQECRLFIHVEKRASNYTTAGYILAHEIAHRFGLDHDDGCECRFPKCVMGYNVITVKEEDTIGWSKCSIKNLVAALDNTKCVKTKEVGPETYATFYSAEWGPTCGNGVVEPGEECDCGGTRACRGNPCCERETCKLASGAKCAVGVCCDLVKCGPRAEGSLCRLAADPVCDFAEKCDGKSHLCPPDVFVNSKWPCDEGGSGAKQCNERYCLDVLKGKMNNYTGPSCPKGQLPVNVGGCRPKSTDPPFVEVDEPDDDDGGGSDDGGGGGGGADADTDGAGFPGPRASTLLVVLISAFARIFSPHRVGI